MNRGVAFLELVAILQRIRTNERDATQDEQAIAEAHAAELGRANHRRDAALTEIEKTRATLTAIRCGAEADLRKVGIAERDLLPNNQVAVESARISELPTLVRHVVRKAREIDDLLQQERRSREIEAKAKQALADLARRPPAPPPPQPQTAPTPPPAPFVEPRPRVSVARTSSVTPLPRPQPTRSRLPLWIALGAAVAILTAVLLYVVFR